MIITQPEFIRRMMEQKARALQGGANDQTIEAIATSVFGNKNSDLLDEVAPKDRYRVWNLYANEAVSENLFKQKAKNPEIWNNYRAWVIDNGRNLIRRLAPDAKDAVVNRSFLTVEYNKSTGQFLLKDKDGGTGGVTTPLERYVESGWIRQRDVETFRQLNEVSRNLSKVFTLEGEDSQQLVSQFIATTLEQFGANPDAQSNENWLTRHYRRMAERAQETRQQAQDALN